MPCGIRIERRILVLYGIRWISVGSSKPRDPSRVPSARRHDPRGGLLGRDPAASPDLRNAWTNEAGHSVRKSKDGFRIGLRTRTPFARHSSKRCCECLVR